MRNRGCFRLSSCARCEHKQGNVVGHRRLEALPETGSLLGVGRLTCLRNLGNRRDSRIVVSEQGTDVVDHDVLDQRALVSEGQEFIHELLVLRYEDPG